MLQIWAIVLIVLGSVLVAGVYVTGVGLVLALLFFGCPCPRKHEKQLDGYAQ